MTPKRMAAVLGERLGFTVIQGYDLGRDPMEDLLGAFEAAIAGAGTGASHVLPSADAKTKARNARALMF